MSRNGDGEKRDATPAAGGLGAVVVSARHVARAGLGRALPALALTNQVEGFDCPGCAWPEAAERGLLEFCENGAKAVAHEATGRLADRDFFARTPHAALLAESGRWLEAQGRLAEPMLRRRGGDRYEPIGWDEAFAHAGRALGALESPDRAVFYTSGRASNEAAFLWQLFVRRFGTNNLPDCSNMCHESSGTGLSEMIGVGKGTVSLADFAEADLILVIGQNPGTNHPRMLTTLEQAARRGAAIVSINPLRERGLVRFSHPQHPLRLLRGGTPLASRFVRVRVGGDVALLKGVMKELLALEDERPGEILDGDFIARHTTGFETFRKALDAAPFDVLSAESGIERAEMRALAELYAGAERTIACWAMGLTQHRFGVDNVQEVMNLLLLRGNVGKPGAGPCPVRGHSNVQGDRTMGIWERPSAAFLDRLGAEFAFAPPRKPGWNTVEALEAMARGEGRVFLALGGNLAAAAPDTAFAEAALARCALTVHVATKLNRTHLLGEESLLLPCLGRTERDVTASGAQFVTVEDSMSAVHRSQGWLDPASAALRSEPAIVAGLARAALGAADAVPWESFAADYDRVRDRIARVVPGFEDFNRRVRKHAGFVLPSGAKTRAFDTPGGRAAFREIPLPRLPLGPGQLVLMTVRSHDQFNTTVYGDDDRYRGVKGDRRIVFLHEDDLRERGLADGDPIDVTSWFEGETRTLRSFKARPYDIPRGCAAAYFPEANALVSVRAFAHGSHTPAYKSIVVTIGKASPLSE
ncbi:MAG TPA: FdhF/YdeP family oxidoreductase [Myxococcota bacterium]|nr:FdhF/YdeP family oxidoreductase [Myxococcota bacterium]